MTQDKELLETEPVSLGSDDDTTALSHSDSSDPVEPQEEREPMPPVESRFMFVDIASLRAKQLRRGALPRVGSPRGEAETEASPGPTEKLERIAMAEIDKGLIVYHIADPEASTDPDGAEAEKDL